MSASTIHGSVTVGRDKIVDQSSLAAASSSEMFGLAAAKLFSPADLALVLKTMQSKLESSLITMSKNEITQIQKEQKDQAEVRLKNLMEQLDKVGKSHKSGTIGLIFGWIAAAAITAAGVAILAASFWTGFGDGVGAAMIVGGVAMMAAMALQTPGPDGHTLMDRITQAFDLCFEAMGIPKEVAHGLTLGVMGSVYAFAAAAAFFIGGPAGSVAVLGGLLPTLVSPENLVKLGMDESDAAKLSLGLTLGMAIATIAVSVGPGLVTGVSSTVSAASRTLPRLVASMSDDMAQFLSRSAKISADMAKATSKMSEPLFDIPGRVSRTLAVRLQAYFGETTAETMGLIGKAGGVGGQGIAGLSTVGTGVAQVKQAQFERELTNARAEEKLLDKFMLDLTEKFQSEKDRLEELVRKLLNFEPIIGMIESSYHAASFVERHN